MTLVTLALGFLPVAVLFLGAAWFTSGRKLNRTAVWVALAEALALTLLAGLWFGSLGSGGWPLVFFLIGVLVAGADRGMRSAFLRSGGRQELVGFLIGVARYLAAGALLAWRLA